MTGWIFLLLTQTAVQPAPPLSDAGAPSLTEPSDARRTAPSEQATATETRTTFDEVMNLFPWIGLGTALGVGAGSVAGGLIVLRLAQADCQALAQCAAPLSASIAQGVGLYAVLTLGGGAAGGAIAGFVDGSVLAGLAGGAVGGALAASFVPIFVFAMLVPSQQAGPVAPATGRVTSRDELVLVFSAVTTSAALLGGLAGQLLVTPLFPEAAPE